MDLELDDPSIGRLEFLGLNVDSALDVDRLKISGFNDDAAPDGLFTARLEFSGLYAMSSTHGTVVF